MSSPSPTVTQSLAPMGRSRLLSLPYELRLDIYERYLNSQYLGAIDEGLMYGGELPSAFVALLLTCRTIYEEVRPILYQKVNISYSLDLWERFFSRIGPHNISLIRDLSICYSCSPDSYWEECRGCEAQEGEPKKIEKWLGIFEALKSAQPNLRLERITLYIEPCQGYWPYEDESPLSSLANRVKHRSCRVYKELELLKTVSQFSDVHQIVLKNQFNPLWALFFRHRLGFVLKRGQYGTMTLVNPNHPDYGVNLKNYVPSKSLKGVYDEIAEEPKQPEEIEEADFDEHDEDVLGWWATFATEYDPSQYWGPEDEI
ncbi:hypothetical protein F5Y05DRAFT_421777 [Hypoxylon sp. FL0543]|nr:hypothetical protein F5Y05DRAFT_421777 [Hypoxylon sp. FL0543]